MKPSNEKIESHPITYEIVTKELKELELAIEHLVEVAKEGNDE